MRDARRLEPPSPVEPEDAGRGETQILIAGGIGGTEIRGAPEIHSTDPLKDARREKLEDPSPAQLKGRTLRGNRNTSPESPQDADEGDPRMRGRHNRKMQAPGATRTLIAKLDGTINDPMSCKDTRKRQGLRSLAFSFSADSGRLR